MPVKAKARLVLHGQHCPDNAQGWVRTNATTVHWTYSFNLCHQWDGVTVSCAFPRGKPRDVEEPWFLEPPSRGLPGIEKGALIEIVKGVFGLPDSHRG